MTKQTELEFADAWAAESSYPELLNIVRQVADEIGRKQVAFDLDVSRSVLDATLADRDRNSLKAKHLLYFARKSTAVAEWLAAFAGGRFEREQQQTPEEELAALKTAVRALGPAGEAIFAMARAK